jgi:hypothetical protein
LKGKSKKKKNWGHILIFENIGGLGSAPGPAKSETILVIKEVVIAEARVVVSAAEFNRDLGLQSIFIILEGKSLRSG